MMPHREEHIRQFARRRQMIQHARVRRSVERRKVGAGTKILAGAGEQHDANLFILGREGKLSFSAPISSSFSALRFSGRFSVMRAIAPSTL